MPNTNIARSLLLATAVGLGAQSSALAEMLVLESNLPQFAVGSHITDAAPALPAGARVKVLMLESNKTKVFEGSKSSAPEDLPFGGMRGKSGR